jgi:hypothetical protein
MKKLVLGLVLVALVAATPVLAHNWGCYNGASDGAIDIENQNGAFSSQAQQAINEWDSDTILCLSSSNSHTDVTVWDANSGNTGWGGLAQIWTQGCNITHCHAQLNTYYSWTSNGARGVHCQEVGHCFGLDHSNDGGCMGGGYYYPIENNYNVVSHNISDIASKYDGSCGGGDPGCGGNGASCSSNGDCCSNKCKNGKCKGNGAQAIEQRHGGDDHSGHDHGESTVHANWYHHPTTLDEAADLSYAIVSARVTGINDGRPIVHDESNIPTQLIAFETRRVLQGELGATFDLFHTGNSTFTLAGDPHYEVGESYLLFLMPRKDGTYLVISPEGRYRVNQGLQPMSEEVFAQTLRGSSVANLTDHLAERRNVRFQK